MKLIKHIDDSSICGIRTPMTTFLLIEGKWYYYNKSLEVLIKASFSRRAQRNYDEVKDSLEYEVISIPLVIKELNEL